MLCPVGPTQCARRSGVKFDYRPFSSKNISAVSHCHIGSLTMSFCRYEFSPMLTYAQSDADVRSVRR